MVKKKENLFYIVLIMFLGLFFGYQSSNNKLITMQKSIDLSWAQIETQLYRRYELTTVIAKHLSLDDSKSSKIISLAQTAGLRWRQSRGQQQRLQLAKDIEATLEQLKHEARKNRGFMQGLKTKKLLAALKESDSLIEIENNIYNAHVAMYNEMLNKKLHRWIANRKGYEARVLFLKSSLDNIAVMNGFSL